MPDSFGCLAVSVMGVDWKSWDTSYWDCTGAMAETEVGTCQWVLGLSVEWMLA